MTNPDKNDPKQPTKQPATKQELDDKALEQVGGGSGGPVPYKQKVIKLEAEH